MLKEGSVVTIDPIMQANDKGNSYVVAYNVNCTFQFLQNDFQNYTALHNDITFYSKYLTSWTCYLQFDSYSRIIGLSPDGYSAPLLELHNIDIKAVDGGDGVVTEIAINSIVDVYQFKNMFALVAS
jgi:hypothetical protein